MAYYSYPANKENNTLFHSVIASPSSSSSASSIPVASAGLNPLAQSQSSHYHRPLPPSPTKTTATAVVNPYGRPHYLAQSMTAATSSATRQPPAYSSSDPTVAQLLAAQGNAHAHAAAFQYPHPNQLRDSTMGNATGIVSWRKGQGFKEWEKAKLDSQEVKRKADVAQLCQSSSSS